MDPVRSLRLTRRLVEGYLHYVDTDPRVKELAGKVMYYNSMLRAYGLRDHQVQKTIMGWHRAALQLSYRVIWLLLMAVIALPG